MSAREGWRFKYTGADLMMAATKRRDHHRDRRVWWAEELDKAEAALKTATVQIIEQPVTGGMRRHAQLDPVHQRRHDECQHKVEHHKTMAEEFDRWRRGFEANPGEVFELAPDDITYFEL